tara:strand:+ start:893 stop:1144 length:252 start_codon:yes stop_codon:yes gene_type:complete
MSTLLITINDSSNTFEVANNTKVYIFDNVKEYKEELCDIIEKNKLTYEEIKMLVESWGGNIDLVNLSTLIKKYKKDELKGLPF